MMDLKIDRRIEARRLVCDGQSLRAMIFAGLVGMAFPVMLAQAQDGGDDAGIEPPPELIEIESPQDTPAVTAGGDRGFPEIVPAPDVPDAQIDGLSYPVGSITLEYVLEHPLLPSVDELMQVRVDLVRIPEGWIGPREGLPVESMTIADLNDGQVRTLYASAIRAIGRAVVKHFGDLEIAGVLVEPDSSQIQSNGRDRRKEGETGLTLQVFTVRATELHSIASGARVPTEERIDSPVHRRILEHSPVLPFREGDPESDRHDLVRRDLLDSYALRLNRHPGRRVDVAVAKGAEQGDVEIHYLVHESKPWTVYFQLSNTGTTNTNEWRERFGFVNNQLTGRDDILSFEYVTAGFDASHALIGSYESRLGDYERFRWRVQGSYNEFDASEVGVLSETFTGSGWTLGGDLIWNFYQRGSFFLDLVGGVRYEHIEITNTTLGASSDGEDNLFLTRIGVEAQRVNETTSFFGSVNLEWTASGISGAEVASLERLGRLSPDKDWVTMQWDTSLSVYLEPLLNHAAWADPSTPASSTLAHELFFSFRGQYAFDNRLIPNSEQVLGGLYTVRGYDESVAAGDSTWVGTMEYRFHLPRALSIEENPTGKLFGRSFKKRPQQVYGQPDWDLVLKGFVDVGQTYNSDRRVFERNETLLGAGVGFELQVLTNVSFRTDWGFVLQDVGNGVAESGDSRVHLVLTILF
jgi:hemolysin activation/secretion protein